MTSLLKAAESGDHIQLEKLLQAGVDPLSPECRGAGSRNPLMIAAAGGHSAACSLLLGAGVPWNDVDENGVTAGEYAIDNGHVECYKALVDAGVRAELILRTIQRKRMKKKLKTDSEGEGEGNSTTEFSSSKYLDSSVQYSADGSRLVSDGDGVMMSWEAPIMEAHANVLCGCSYNDDNGKDAQVQVQEPYDGDILNIGFGMGIIDGFIQRKKPKTHTIVEAHPDVLKKMRDDGWMEKEGVIVLEGRWQDVQSQLGTYDGIMFDTFAEDEEELNKFNALVPRILKEGGIYTYFNGLCAGNKFYHDVAREVVTLDLFEQDLETMWIPLPVSIDKEKEWEGLNRAYWQLDTYYLPVVSKMISL